MDAVHVNDLKIFFNEWWSILIILFFFFFNEKWIYTYQQERMIIINVTRSCIEKVLPLGFALYGLYHFNLGLRWSFSTGGSTGNVVFRPRYWRLPVALSHFTLPTISRSFRKQTPSGRNAMLPIWSFIISSHTTAAWWCMNAGAWEKLTN